jgi:hypothetical protein
MTMTVATAAARIGREIPEAECSLDDALLASARLMQSMILARRADGVEAHAGQSTLMRLMKSQQSIVAAANDMFRVHRELLTLGHEVKAMSDENGSCPKRAELATPVETAFVQAA